MCSFSSQQIPEQRVVKLQQMRDQQKECIESWIESTTVMIIYDESRYVEYFHIGKFHVSE